MSELFTVKTWAKSLPSRDHLERNEDLYWTSANGVAHAVIDGMGGSRRIVAGKEVGGEHAARGLHDALEARLQGLPQNLTIESAKQLISIAIAEGGARIFKEVNASGNIPPEEIPEWKMAEDVMAAAVMTVVIFCDGGRRAVISQNGDTRCYLYSAGELILLTDDQDAVTADVQKGVLTEEEAMLLGEELDGFDGYDVGKLSPMARHYFAQRYLTAGQLGDSEVATSPVFSTIKLQPGDTLVLTSDGVHDNLSTNEIGAALQSIDPAATLVDRADARSGERHLPDPANPNAAYNYRAHMDDATALIVKIEW